jgi:hypothetical protein
MRSLPPAVASSARYILRQIVLVSLAELVDCDAALPIIRQMIVTTELESRVAALEARSARTKGQRNGR